MKFNKPVDNEICVQGNVLATQKEDLSWNDKATGLARQGVRFSVILQGSYGIVFARSFNPSDDLKALKPGDVVFLPIDKFEKENGMKVATLLRGL